MSVGIFAVLLLLQPNTQALPLPKVAFQGVVITEGPGSQIFDLSPQGQLSKPRSITYQASSNLGFICLAESQTGGWYGISGVFSGSSYPQHLFTVNTSGLSGVAGMLGLPFNEGDCAFDPTTQKLWAVRSGGELYTIDLANPAKPTLVATIPGVSDVSAMAFDKAGQLYCLDLGGGGKLLKISKAGVVLSTIPLSSPVKVGNGNAAMAIDSPDSAYVILPVLKSGSIYTQNLYRIGLSGGELTKLGETGQSRITGMVVKITSLQRRAN